MSYKAHSFNSMSKTESAVMSAATLRAMAEKIAADPDHVDVLTTEELNEVRKYTNPYGSNFSAKKSWANITITNYRDEYFKKMYMYGMIAFLFRLASEATPTEEIDLIRAETKKMCDGYRADLAAGSLEQAKYNALVKHAEERREQKIESATRLYRTIVGKFLRSQFEYDPDRHVREAKTTNAADPERRVDPKGWAEGQAARGKAVAARMQAEPAKLYKYLHDNVLAGYQIMTECTAMLRSICGATSLSQEDLQGLALKLYARSKGLTEDMHKIAEPLSAAETLEAYRVSPPADVFHHFGRYIQNNYEAIQSMVRDFSGLRPDFEFAVIFHRAFKSEEAAREHRIAHENEFRSPVLTVENSGITLLGPYRENADRIDFYNKNTEILKNMADQNADDSKLGQDIMRKKITREKKRNIDECGLDGEGLAHFTRGGTLTHDPKMNMTNMGAFKGMTREDQEKYVAEKGLTTPQEVTAKDECPDDALECAMYFTQVDAEGKQTLKSTTFYTQAEAPLHGQDGSDYVDTYQPIQSEVALTTKVITGRDGTKKKIKVPLKSE